MNDYFEVMTIAENVYQIYEPGGVGSALVIGGEKAAVDRAGELAKELGAKRCLPLKVSGPFHTGLMNPPVRPVSSVP